MDPISLTILCTFTNVPLLNSKFIDVITKWKFGARIRHASRSTGDAVRVHDLTTVATIRTEKKILDKLSYIFAVVVGLLQETKPLQFCEYYGIRFSLSGFPKQVGDSVQ